MAETITYEVTINPRTSTTTATAVDGGSVDQVILDPTNLDAIRLLITKIRNRINVSAVVTAINNAVTPL